MPRSKYKVTLNWHGEIHIYHTTATSPHSALQHSCVKLAQKLDIVKGVVIQHFMGLQGQYKVVKV